MYGGEGGEGRNNENYVYYIILLGFSLGLIKIFLRRECENPLPLQRVITNCDDHEQREPRYHGGQSLIIKAKKHQTVRPLVQSVIARIGLPFGQVRANNFPREARCRYIRSYFV